MHLGKTSRSSAACSSEMLFSVLLSCLLCSCLLRWFLFFICRSCCLDSIALDEVICFLVAQIFLQKFWVDH
jgi:hypothetical protein